VRLVNLGCGARYHGDWINIDLHQTGPGVIAHDLAEGLPLDDDSCDAVYSSAMLEHFRRSDTPRFLGECYRVLRPSGIVRIAVPDLEAICRLYLSKLNDAVRGVPGASDDYDWMMLELYDQVARENSGGHMLAYFRQPVIPNAEFVYSRVGEIMHEVRDVPTQDAGSVSRVRRTLFQRAMNRARWLLHSRRRREPQQEIGAFRLSGEVHHWMYDRYSLARLLLQAGFSKPRRCSPLESDIPEWERYQLDAMPDGTPVKPDCFYMEARKPGA
jgi:predicted SAM-dependent methyltransferase